MPNLAEQAVEHKKVRVNVPIERALERQGEGYEKLRDLFNGPGAWVHILGLFATAANGEVL